MAREVKPPFATLASLARVLVQILLIHLGWQEGEQEFWVPGFDLVKPPL